MFRHPVVPRLRLSYHLQCPQINVDLFFSSNDLVGVEGVLLLREPRAVETVRKFHESVFDPSRAVPTAHHPLSPPTTSTRDSPKGENVT